MEFIKKYSKVNANSVLESVVSLCIISVCLYVAIVVYGSVFTTKASVKFYATNNRLDQLFFLMQAQDDLIYSNDNSNIKIEEEFMNANLKQITVSYKDSVGNTFQKKYYVSKTNE